MKNWKEFRILGVSVMDTRKGQTNLREPWKWAIGGILTGVPIAAGFGHAANLNQSQGGMYI